MVSVQGSKIFFRGGRGTSGFFFRDRRHAVFLGVMLRTQKLAPQLSNTQTPTKLNGMGMPWWSRRTLSKLPQGTLCCSAVRYKKMNCSGSGSKFFSGCATNHKFAGVGESPTATVGHSKKPGLWSLQLPGVLQAHNANGACPDLAVGLTAIPPPSIDLNDDLNGCYTK